jgi:hypothetical protein
MHNQLRGAGYIFAAGKVDRFAYTGTTGSAALAFEALSSVPADALATMPDALPSRPLPAHQSLETEEHPHG